jgi:chemotaxis methyl-accepting protein methylase
MSKPEGISGAGNGINGVSKKAFNMSSFFRNLYQIRALRQVLRKVFERSSSKPIRVWVPGCSDGREAYSIAILIREEGYHLSRKIEIIGTDVDPKIIMLAAQGVYPKLDGRQEAGVSAEKDRNRALMDGKFDVVSCHNVLMHLSDVDKITAAGVLLEKIETDGFLVTNDAIFRVCDNLSRLPVEENAYGYSAYQLKSR